MKWKKPLMPQELDFRAKSMIAKSKKEIYMFRAVMVSLFCNVVLVAIKATAFIVVHSLAIAVDLGISVVGLTISVILYYSIKLTLRPADRMHNYGYGKVENVCEALEGVVLIGIALAMSFQAVMFILRPAHVDMPWIGLFSSLMNSILNFGGAVYITRMAQKSGSPSIHAEGVHYRLEGFISVMIAGSFVVSMLLHNRGYDNLALYADPFAALLVSMILVIPSFKLAKNAFFKLLDASVEEGSQMEIIRQLAAHIQKYCEFKQLKTRTAGRKKFVELTVIVPSNSSVKTAYYTVQSLQQDIKDSIPGSEVTVHIEPCKGDCDYAKRKNACPYVKKELLREDEAVLV